MSIVKGINVEHKHEEEQTKKSPEKFQVYYLIIKPITYHRGLLTWGGDFYNQNNGAMLRPPVPRHIRGPVLKSKSEAVKFVDDGTVAVSIDLSDT